MEPIAVRSVRSRVAQAGWKSAPPSTFYNIKKNRSTLGELLERGKHAPKRHYPALTTRASKRQKPKEHR